MVISSFHKILFSLSFGAFFAISISSYPYEARADYPLDSVKFLLVEETYACRSEIGYGYESKPCNTLDYKMDIEPLLQSKTAILFKKEGIPEGSKVELNGRFRSELAEYSRNRYKKPALSVGQRKSVIVVFDFGSLLRDSDLDVQLNYSQSKDKLLCVDEQFNFPARTYPRSGYYKLSKANQYWMYHTSAEVFSACSNVTWTLIVKEAKTGGKQYKPWKFGTVIP